MKFKFLAPLCLALSCAGVQRRPVEFHPAELGASKEPAVFVCYQDGKSDKLVCVDFESFMLSLQADVEPTIHEL